MFTKCLAAANTFEIFQKHRSEKSIKKQQIAIQANKLKIGVPLELGYQKIPMSKWEIDWISINKFVIATISAKMVVL